MEAGRYDLSRTANRRFQAWCEVWARECHRVLKPGGHIAAFGSARTSHRLAAGIEDAGFEMRDSLMWLFASGFPKSLNVARAIDGMGGDPGLLREMAEAFRKAREDRGWSVAQADEHFCGASTAWAFYEGRTFNKRFHVQPPNAERAKRIADEWPELASVLDRLRQQGELTGQATHRRSGGEDFGKVVGAESSERTVDVHALGTDAARKWSGWGTALKPAYEPIIVGRKPLSEANIAANVLEHGTGAINVDACRIATGDRLGGGDQKTGREKAPHGEGWDRPWMNDPEALEAHAERVNGNVAHAERLGRWPSNLLLSHSEDCVLLGTREVRNDGGSLSDAGPRQNGVFNPHKADRGDWQAYGESGVETVERWACVPGCPVRMLDDATGDLGKSSGTSGAGAYGTGVTYGTGMGQERGGRVGFGDRGGASRFFFCGKASRLERNAGLDGFEEREVLWSSGEQNPGAFQSENTDRSQRNYHPTVKPLDLMRWLVRLLTPPGGTVLDPFCGSGTTGCAAALEGVEFVGIERDEDKDGKSLGYIAIAEARIKFWASKPQGIDTRAVLRAELAKPERHGQLSIL